MGNECSRTENNHRLASAPFSRLREQYAPRMLAASVLNLAYRSIVPNGVSLERTGSSPAATGALSRRYAASDRTRKHASRDDEPNVANRSFFTLFAHSAGSVASRRRLPCGRIASKPAFISEGESDSGCWPVAIGSSSRTGGARLFLPVRSVQIAVSVRLSSSTSTVLRLTLDDRPTVHSRYLGPPPFRSTSRPRAGPRS